jgi:hypothetical protein
MFDPNKPADNSPLDAGEMRNQLNGLKALIDLVLPVGFIGGWAKNLTGVPALIGTWAECNGQVLNDAQSPLNGQTLPDLNGAGGPQRFLRGAAMSGGTGGGDSLNIPSEVPVDNNMDASTTTVVSGPQSDLPILPSYYEVVWVVRVK